MEPELNVYHEKTAKPYNRGGYKVKQGQRKRTLFDLIQDVLCVCFGAIFMILAVFKECPKDIWFMPVIVWLIGFLLFVVGVSPMKKIGKS